MSDQTFRTGAPVEAKWDSFQQHWRWLLALGILWIVLGALAIILPFAATIAFELILGVIFAVGGLVQIFQAFRSREWPGFGVHVFGGILALALGIVFLLFPVQGVVAMTVFLCAFFFAGGVTKIVSAIQHRSFQNWGWMLFSGILGIIIAVLIWFAAAGGIMWVVGLLVGIELVFSGWGMIMLAIAARCP